jgi:threonylcarbamoyladenosine tRNA methylthiotransferase MtaB
MPQVPKPVVRERAARLRAAGDAARRRAVERVVGKTVSALVEQPGLGRSEHYLPVRLPASAAEGEVRAARIVAATDKILVAEGAS